MMNIKVIILLSLATYASCSSIGSSLDEERKTNIQKYETSSSISGGDPAELKKELELKVLELIKQRHKNPDSAPPEPKTEYDQKIEDNVKVVQNSYFDCLNWVKYDLKIPKNRMCITTGKFVIYMGIESEFPKILKGYFTDNPQKKFDEYVELDIVRFAELFIHTCNQLGQSLQTCSTNKRNQRIERRQGNITLSS